MTTVAQLTPPDVPIAPGGVAQCTLTVQNRGEIVEGYQLELLGDLAEWGSVEPQQLHVYPGTQATTTIRFDLSQAPRMHAQDIPFAVRVLPMENPKQVVVPEGQLRVGVVNDLAGELLPTTSRTRRVTVHDVAIDNLGNTPTVVELSVSDPDNALKVSPKPLRLAIPPGHAGVASVRIKHRKLKLRGQPTPRKFRITAATQNGPGVVLDGTSVQEPVLGRWVFVAAAALLVLALLGAGLWFGLVKPAVKSEAGKAANKAVAQKVAEAAGAAVPEGAAAGGGGAPGSGTSATPQSSATALSGAPGAPGSGGTDASGRPLVATPIYYPIPAKDAVGGGSFNGVVRPASANRFTLGFVAISAPQGDTAQIQIVAGTGNKSAVLWDYNLANLRDYDIHPPQIEVPLNTPLRIVLTCQTPGPLRQPGIPADTCYANVLVSGTEYKPVAP